MDKSSMNAGDLMAKNKAINPSWKLPSVESSLFSLRRCAYRRRWFSRSQRACTNNGGLLCSAVKAKIFLNGLICRFVTSTRCRFTTLLCCRDDRTRRRKGDDEKMMPGKLFFHLKLLFCMVVVATEGKKKKVKKNVNMCEIEEAQVIFCYCDILEIDKAEEGNCWIFNDTSEHEDIWDSFASQTKIKRLTLHLRPDGSLKAIPSEAIGYLSSLEFFEVQYATFGTVSAFSFGNSTTLSKISLARNSIKTLARNAFAHLTSLTFLSLGENHITEVNRHVFVNLPNLTELYMDRNNITILHDRAFQNLHGLTNLALFSNQIQVITPDTFRGLLSLDTLDLSKNRLEVIGNNTFEELRSLRTLDLQENSLKYIAPNGFQGLNNLLKLNLQDNKLLKIGSEVFKRAPKVVHLDIRANVLSTLAYETVEPIFSNLKNHTMMFFLEDNNFRCDTRLSWMFVLHNTTSSSSVRRNLESLFCYLEVGTLPPRLDGQTVTPAYDTTTLGIGPMTKLFDLHEHELPMPVSWMQTIDPDCEEEHLRHGASTNKESGRNKAQNDMAPVQDMVQAGNGNSGVHSFTSFHNSQPPSNVALISGILTPVTAFSLVIWLVQLQ